MELYDAIFYRRTIRNYSNKNINEPLMKEVKKICSEITYLNKDLKITAHVIERGHLIHFLMGKECKVKAPHYIVVSCNKGEDYLQNIGFAIEKIVLQLTTLGLGTCWLECDIKREDIEEFVYYEDEERVYGRLHEKKVLCEDKEIEEEIEDEDEIEKPCIAIAFGYAEKEEKLFELTDAHRRRKRIKHISKKMDRKWIKILNSVTVAPSIKNSQPWMFYNYKNRIDVYEEKPKKGLEDMSKVSMGIALRHFDMACKKYDIDVEYQKSDAKKRLGKNYYISILEKI